MVKPAFLAMCVLGAAMVGSADRAGAQDGRHAQTTAQATVEQPAQARRARPRVRVYRQQQPAAWDYPRPGDVSWPGAGAVRECVSWLAQEYRPSGTVITPQMRCRWVRG